MAENRRTIIWPEPAWSELPRKAAERGIAETGIPWSVSEYLRRSEESYAALASVVSALASIRRSLESWSGDGFAKVLIHSTDAEALIAAVNLRRAEEMYHGEGRLRGVRPSEDVFGPLGKPDGMAGMVHEGDGEKDGVGRGDHPSDSRPAQYSESVIGSEDRGRISTPSAGTSHAPGGAVKRGAVKREARAPSTGESDPAIIDAAVRRAINTVVGAEVVSVPASVPFTKERQTGKRK